MQPDIEKLIMTSDHNAFKNDSVQRGNLIIPASMLNGVQTTTQVTFTLTESANFIQAYVYNTDYGDYFNYLDSAYHDAWRQVNSSVDYLLFTSGGLYNYIIRMYLQGNNVTFTFSVRNVGAVPLTINHPTHLIPITFIEYTLDR